MMCHSRNSRSHRLAFMVSGLAPLGIALMLAGAAQAQTVQMFDEAPSLEQLRSIMIPESHPGSGRTIVIQRPDTGTPAQAVQRVATQVLAPRPAAVPAPQVSAPVAQQVSAPKPANIPPANAQPVNAQPGTVGFRINFAFNSAILPDSAHAMIEVVAQVMKGSPDIKVRVEGHTDAVGSADYNAALSERRALSVGAYLVRLGIEPSRLELVGKGMAEPLTHNPYDPQNRRVQFVRMG